MMRRNVGRFEGVSLHIMDILEFKTHLEREELLLGRSLVLGPGQIV
jgi:hypothetical protein